MNSQFQDYLKNNLDLDLSPKEISDFKTYLAELIAYNKKFNLTRIIDPEKIWCFHFIDSLTLQIFFRFLKSNLNNTDYFLSKPGFKVIDIGSGAGFPGIPLKIIYPFWEMTLLESTRKKIFFLETITKKLHLQKINVVWNRAETIAQDRNYRQQYELGLMRALSDLTIGLELSLPLIRPDGYMVFWKSEINKNEISAIKPVLKILGGEFLTLLEYILPGQETKRNLVIFKKVHETPEKYPRRAGIPSKYPLNKIVTAM